MGVFLAGERLSLTRVCPASDLHGGRLRRRNLLTRQRKNPSTGLHIPPPICYNKGVAVPAATHNHTQTAKLSGHKADPAVW